MSPTLGPALKRYLLPFILLCASLVLLPAWPVPAAQAKLSGDPLAGNLMWVWYSPQTPAGREKMIRQLKATGMTGVLIKSGDGPKVWKQFNSKLVRQLHQAGLHVCAWHYVYGTHPIQEARVSAWAYRQGAECMIIDAETEYEGRPHAAWVYTDQLRRLTSKHWLLGLSSFPYLKYHTRFPYRTFLRPGAAQVNLPQMYWRDIGVSASRIVRDTYQVNRALGRPVYPIGQTWNNPGRGDLQEFQRAARKAGARGISWWDWSQTSQASWKELARKRWPGVKVPTVDPTPTRAASKLAGSIGLLHNKPPAVKALFSAKPTPPVLSLTKNNNQSPGAADRLSGVLPGTSSTGILPLNPTRGLAGS